MSFDLQHGFSLLKSMFREFILLFIWAAVAFYLMYFYGYKYFESRKYFIYTLYCIVVAVITTTILFPIISFFHTKNIVNYSFSDILPSCFGTLILANCGSLLKGFIKWATLTHHQIELEKRSFQHELESLRSQMNPHFLFNTLNNIDSLIFSAPQKASEMLLKLSEIMRYMLYDTQEKKVLLQKEIEHIENIIALQQLRFTNPNHIIFRKINCFKHITIEPLVLTPFIENAFKYACDLGQVPVVEIEISCNSNSIIFNCKNTYNPNKISYSKDVGGIGLKNVKRRLELLYSNSHNLEISDKLNTFEVNLSIETHMQ